MATLRIKITMKNGNVIEAEKELTKARSLLGDVLAHGYFDSATSRSYPVDAILNIDVMPPSELPRFSDN